MRHPSKRGRKLAKDGHLCLSTKVRGHVTCCSVLLSRKFKVRLRRMGGCHLVVLSDLKRRETGMASLQTIATLSAQSMHANVLGGCFGNPSHSSTPCDPVPALYPPFMGARTSQVLSLHVRPPSLLARGGIGTHCDSGRVLEGSSGVSKGLLPPFRTTAEALCATESPTPGLSWAHAPADTPCC